MTTRIPPLDRAEMDPDQQAIHDRILADSGRIGFGPAIGYAYSGPVWDLHNRSSDFLLNCTLTNPQVRIVSLMTVRRWNAPYPWSAQAKTALNAGLSKEVVEAINEGTEPPFENDDDRAVWAAARELLEAGTLSDAGFAAAEAALGRRKLVEIVHCIGHFCTTALMANLVGVTPPEDAVSVLKG